MFPNILDNAIVYFYTQKGIMEVFPMIMEK